MLVNYKNNPRNYMQGIMVSDGISFASVGSNSGGDNRNIGKNTGVEMNTSRRPQ